MHYIENNLPIHSYRLKEKLIRDGIKKDCCEICGCSVWQGIKLPLELHHKNCNHNDNTLENLQILCPNCHAQTDNYCGKNIPKSKYELKPSETFLIYLNTKASSSKSSE